MLSIEAIKQFIELLINPFFLGFIELVIILIFCLKIVDRYIIKELIKPFLLGISGFIVVMLSIRISQDINLIITQKIPVNYVLQMMLYKFPEYIVMGTPVAYLIATLLMLARLGKDNEITALRSVGVNLKRIILPILAMSTVVCYMSFLFMEYLVPYSNQKSNEIMYNVKKIKEGQVIVTDFQFRGVDSRIFAIKKIDQEKKLLEEIIIYDTNPNQTSIITAKNGTWEGEYWLLENGIVHKYSTKIKSGVGEFVHTEEPFEKMEVHTKLLLEDFITEKKPQEMSSKELKSIINTRKIGGQDTKKLEVEYELKFAKPLASFFAALIASCIGAKFSRFGGYIGVALSIILIFIYFVTESITVMVGNLGVISPFIAAWGPNLLFALIGLLLLLIIDK